MIKELSIVCPATGGLPIAFGLCEALRAHQVYWSEQAGEGAPLRFRQYLEVQPGEKVLLVDDILRSGKHLTQLKELIESNGASVVGIAVAVYQPNPTMFDFGNLPLFYLAKMDATYYRDSAACELCRQGLPVEKIWV
jgi:orotate phosphoribosyltransferase